MKYIKEFICENMPTDNCHASTVLPLSDGSVISAWFGGTKEGSGDVDIWYSRRDKDGWSEPSRMSKSKKIPHWNPVLLLTPDNKICLFFKVGKKIPSWRTFYAISENGGKDFSAPQVLINGDKSGGRGPVKNKCITLSNGRILAPASTENNGWNCFVDISDDGGKSWRKSARVPTERSSSILNSLNEHSTNLIPMIQPTLWESAPDKVHMLTRTAVGRAYRSDSEDNGETWCKAYPTSLPNNNSGLDLVKAPDGKLWLVSNPVSENWGERSPLTLQCSEDNGVSWRSVLTLEEENIGSEFSYPAIEYLNGILYITYTYERKKIAFVRVLLEDEKL